MNRIRLIVATTSICVLSSCFRDNPTQLAEAIDENDLQRVELLFETAHDKGGLANARFKDGQTMLHYAVSKCDTQIAQLLLDNGAEFYDSPMEQYSLIGDAVSCENTEIVRFLVDAGADPELNGAYAAALVGKGEVFNHYFRLGVDVNRLYFGKSSLLQVAIIGKDIGIITAILELGADINQWDELYGDYPIHTAVSIDFGEDVIPIIELLLEWGADPNLVNQNGLNAFQAAEKYNGDRSLQVMQNYLNRNRE